MKSLLRIPVFLFLLVFAARPCSALMGLEMVTKERAKELGMEIRTNAAGPDAVRIELEFDPKGQLKSFSRIELNIHSEGKLLASSTLREERLASGHILVSFAADRASLHKFTLRVVTETSSRTRAAHDLPMKDFVDLEKIR